MPAATLRGAARLYATGGNAAIYYGLGVTEHSQGSTTVIGGIYQNSETISVNSTPVLGQIPLLGYLFRQKGRSTSNNELLLFITPRITKG